jgi:hypothetical protein
MHILDLCRDPHGRLSVERRALLKRLLEAPDQRTWERARGIVIRPLPVVTLAMAVRSVRSDGDTRSVPDPFTLYRALRFAVDYESRRSKPFRGGICR